MSTLDESPILAFLMRKDNLPSVLEIVRYGQEVRERVAKQFWEDFQSALEKNRPKEINLALSWEPIIGSKPDDCFGMVVRLGLADKKTQGFKYMIEAQASYLGLGLAWLNTANNFKQLSETKEVQALQAELRKRPNGDDVEPEPNEWWLWWEYWERNPYNDPWCWFAKDLGDAWSKDKSAKFWDLVGQTHRLVAEANIALKRA